MIPTGPRGKKSSGIPITSYGIILFTYDSGKEPKFLLYQRRDSYEYMDFLRGIWGNETRVSELLSLMSSDERERLQNYSFDELWNDLWVNHDCSIYNDGYDRGKKKYESIRSKLPDLLGRSKKHAYNPPPWGFPKGKKNTKSHEADVDCALREFTEETGLPTDKIKVWPIKAFSESYRGNNGKSYRTYYYIAECPTVLPVCKISTPNCIRKEAVSEEAADAIWVSYSTACSKIEPRRQSILKSVLHNITVHKNLSPFSTMSPKMS